MSIKTYNGKIAKIFNRDNKKTGFVTFGDIENVARTDEDNFFFYNNFFNFISVSNINGIARATFQYFSGLSENIQTALTSIRSMIFGIQADVLVIKNQNTTFRDDIDKLQDEKADITYVDSEILILETNKADINLVNNKIITLKNEILAGASSAYDTLLEIQNILEDDTKMNELLTLINQKANQSSLNTTNYNLSLLSNDILNLQTVKADINFVNNKITTLKNEILGDVNSSYDTLLEIQQFLQNDASQIQALFNLVASKANQSSLDITNNNLSILSGNCYNITYQNGKTTINNNLKTLDIESNLIQSSNISSNTININKINTDKIFTNYLKTDKIYCYSLKSDFIEYKNDVGIHLYINNIHFPIMRSQNNFSLIYSEPVTNLKLTIKPNYTLKLYNSNDIIYHYTNNTDDFQYYLNIDKYNFTHLKIYLNNILLD